MICHALAIILKQSFPVRLENGLYGIIFMKMSSVSSHFVKDNQLKHYIGENVANIGQF